MDSITAENLHLLRVGESKKITTIVGPEAASQPNLVWIPYNSSIIQIMESGQVDKTTGYAVVKGLKVGISKLSVVANDDDNYQIGLKAAVVPAKVNNLVGTAGTQYQYKIGAYISDSDGIYEGDHTEAVVLSTQRAPETVTVVPFNERKVGNFKISKNYTTKVKLLWTKDKEAQGYQIYQYKSKKWKQVAAIKKDSVKSAAVNKLTPGTPYKFRIRAYKKEDGKTIYTQYTTLQVMTMPSKVAVTSVSAGKKQVTLKWKKIKASGYEIQCCTSKTFKKNVIKATVKKSKKTAIVKKLKGGKTYYVRIRAYSKVNGKKYYGAWSKVTKVKVGE